MQFLKFFLMSDMTLLKFVPISRPSTRFKKYEKKTPSDIYRKYDTPSALSQIFNLNVIYWEN